MRHSPWTVSVLTLALGACSENQVASTEVASATEALVGELDPFTCTLGAACEDWGELIDVPSVVATECEPRGAVQLAPAWYTKLDGIPCPLGRCAMSTIASVDILLERDGSLLTLYPVALPSPMQLAREGGLWLTRHDANGSQLGSRLWDFAIPPPGVEVRRHAQLLSDAQGDAMLVAARATFPRDERWPVTVATIGGQGAPKPREPRAQTPAYRASAYQSAFGPRGELLVGTLHTTDLEQRVVLTLFDRRGRLLWNRPWLSAASWTELRALHIDADGGVLVQLLDSFDGPWSEGFTTIARLDGEGNVQWRRQIEDAQTVVQSSFDAAGNVYALSTTWGLDSLEARLERIDRFGQNTGAWSFSDLGFGAAEVLPGQDGAFVVVREEVELGLVLSLVPFSSDMAAGAACPSTSYSWPGTLDDFFSHTTALAESPGGDVYAAFGPVTLKLQGGAP